MLSALPNNWPEPRLLTLVGSRAYGMSTEGSDWDYKGFYIAPSEDFWRFKVPDTQYQATSLGQERDLDVTLWEVGKFLHLCLQGNPAVLEVLYGDTPKVSSLQAELILAARDTFLSKKVAHTYKGYAASQIFKSKRDLKRGEELRPKSLMHCFRLLTTGKEILEGGPVRVHAGPHIDTLQKIRAEEIPQEEALQMCEDLFEEFDSFKDKSSLPEEPDHKRAESILLQIRREGMVRG